MEKRTQMSFLRGLHVIEFKAKSSSNTRFTWKEFHEIFQTSEYGSYCYHIDKSISTQVFYFLKSN